MIAIPQPSMALNAVDPWDKKYTVPRPRYEMEYSRNIGKDLNPQDVFENVRHVASLTKEGKLKFLVINCHGDYYSKTVGGKGLDLGTGINFMNDIVFSRLADVVEGIYLVACGIAQNQSLCGSFAMYANAPVYAANDIQRGSPFQALFNVRKNHIDRFEGDFYEFKPDGTGTVMAQPRLRQR
jgi:hypothetical protein